MPDTSKSTTHERTSFSLRVASTRSLPSTSFITLYAYQLSAVM